jgi:hypothetical protein
VDVEALFGAGVACAYRGHDSAASQYLSKATAINVAGRSASLLSDKDSLLSYTNTLAQSHETTPLTRQRLILISQLHLLGGSPSTAVRAAEGAVQLAPESADARKQLALCRSALRSDEEALQEWAWYREQRPDDPLALLVMGIVARRAKRPGLAIDCLEHAASISLPFAAPCLELTEIYGASGDTENARKWAREYTKRNPYGDERASIYGETQDRRRAPHRTERVVTPNIGF